MTKHYSLRILAIGCLVGLAFSPESLAADTVETADTMPQLSPLATTGPKPRAITAPTADEVDAAIVRGVDFLLSIQNKNGSWGSARRTKGMNLYAPAPGAHHAFRSAVTSLGLMALLEYQTHMEYQASSAHSPGDERAKRVASAVERGEAWLFAHLPSLRRADAEALYNTWGHAYSLQAIVRLAGRPDISEERQTAYRRLAAGQAEMLERYHLVDGGWAYYDFNAHTRQPSGSSICFTTATALVGLHEAKTLGACVSDKTIQTALASIRRQQKPDFSYVYGEYLKYRPMRGINRPAGSLGRSQVCNLALRYFGDQKITDEILKTWLDRMYARDGWQSLGRKKPIPHESFFSISGYFYYYGYYYGALCIDELPEPARPHFQDHMAHILLGRQEKDGCWWDYPMFDYHQQYGTAMAIMSLLRCRR